MKTRTVVLLLRVRYRLSRRGQPDQFAEEVITTGYRSDGSEVRWFEANHAEVLELLEKAEAVGNITSAEKQQRLEAALQEVQATRGKLQGIADGHCRELEAAHDRLKQQIGGAKVTATAYEPDILGIHILLPGGKA